MLVQKAMLQEDANELEVREVKEQLSRVSMENQNLSSKVKIQKEQSKLLFRLNPWPLPPSLKFMLLWMFYVHVAVDDTVFNDIQCTRSVDLSSGFS